MKTYYSDAYELWDAMKQADGSMTRDFELSHYGEELDEAAGYVLLYKGSAHDIYKVNKIVEMFYNKLVSSGFGNNVKLVHRKIERTDKYNKSYQEAMIELFPGLYPGENAETPFADEENF